uniref:Uncharacterized protein n=1 Tax=Anopheles merus TaxID=30066 RepID=A0A182V8W9_ANOME
MARLVDALLLRLVQLLEGEWIKAAKVRHRVVLLELLQWMGRGKVGRQLRERSGCSFMCVARSRFASSMNGRFWASVSSFHSEPSRLEISELCIFGLSFAIWRRCSRDHTMNAFIGRLMCPSWPGECLVA